jgi:large subunit ribosomal protein L31e
MADKQSKELERIYTIPLRQLKSSPRNHRSDRAVKAVKNYLSKHMKSDQIWIDGSVNEKLWARGMYTIPSKIRVRALKFDDGVVEVTLPEADITTSRREEIKKRREESAAEREKKTEKKDKTEGKTDEEKAKDADLKAEGETKEGGAEKKEAASDKPKQQAKPESGEKPKQPKAPKADTEATPKTEKAGHKADAKSTSQAKPQPKKE